MWQQILHTGCDVDPLFFNLLNHCDMGKGYHCLAIEVGSWTHVFSLEINKHALPIIMTESREVHFHSDWCSCFLLDVLLKHKFHYVNLRGRSLDNMKNEPNNTHMLYSQWGHISTIGKNCAQHQSSTREAMAKSEYEKLACRLRKSLIWRKPNLTFY